MSQVTWEASARAGREPQRSASRGQAHYPYAMSLRTFSRSGLQSPESINSTGQSLPYYYSVEVYAQHPDIQVKYKQRGSLLLASKTQTLFFLIAKTVAGNIVLYGNKLDFKNNF